MHDISDTGIRCRDHDTSTQLRQTIHSLQGHTEAVNAVAATPDGRRAVSASNDRTLRVWDLESGKEITTFTGESGMWGCAVTSDGRTIITGDASGRVHFLRLVSNRQYKDPAPAA